MQRREVIATVGTATAAGIAGCNSFDDSENSTPTGSEGATQTDSTELAHTVSVYSSDTEVTREVSVMVTDGTGTPLFEQEYTLSDSNEADEDALFPASTNPETVVVTVDGTRFERHWPDSEHPELPCNDATRSGIEIWIRTDQDRSPALRMEANCQTAVVDG